MRYSTTMSLLFRNKIAYLTIYVLLYSLLLLFIINFHELGNNTQQAECAYVTEKYKYDDIYFYNMIWTDNQPCLLSAEGLMFFYAAFTLVYLLFLPFLSSLRWRIWSEKRNNTLLEWCIFSMFYAIVLVFHHQQYGVEVDNAFIRAIGGSFILFFPFILYNLLRVIWQKKISYFRN